jgi:hypothetical protein
MATPPLSDSALDTEKLKADIAKTQAEAKKTNLEARELSRIFLLRPSALASLATIFVTVGAGVAAYANGWFGIKTEGLQVKQERLQYENEKLDDRKDDLSKQINDLTAQRDALARKLSGASASAEELKKRISALSIKATEADLYRKQVSDIQSTLQKTQTDLSSEKSKNTDLEIEEQFRINHPNLNPGNSVLFRIDDSSYKPIENYQIAYANGEEFPCYSIARGVCFHPRTQDEETDRMIRVRITADGYKPKDYIYPSTSGGGPAIVLNR